MLVIRTTALIFHTKVGWVNNEFLKICLRRKSVSLHFRAVKRVSHYKKAAELDRVGHLSQSLGAVLHFQLLWWWVLGHFIPMDLFWMCSVSRWSYLWDLRGALKAASDLSFSYAQNAWSSTSETLPESRLLLSPFYLLIDGCRGCYKLIPYWWTFSLFSSFCVLLRLVNNTAHIFNCNLSLSLQKRNQIFWLKDFGTVTRLASLHPGQHYFMKYRMSSNPNYISLHPFSLLCSHSCHQAFPLAFLLVCPIPSYSQSSFSHFREPSAQGIVRTS
jgi:hypothetical protein